MVLGELKKIENGGKTDGKLKKGMILLDVETSLARFGSKTITLEELSKNRVGHRVVKVGGNRMVDPNNRTHLRNFINVSSFLEIKKISRQVVKETGIKIPEKIIKNVIYGIYPPLGIVHKDQIVKVIDNKYGRKL